MDIQQNKETAQSYEGIIITVLLFFCFCVVVLQIFARNFTNNPPIWTEEMARWIWVWLVFIGVIEVERIDGQLKMLFFIQKFSLTMQDVINSIFDVLYCLTLLLLLWVGYHEVVRNSTSMSVTLPISTAFLYLAHPVSAVFIIMRVSQRIVIRIKHHASKEVL